MESTTRRKFIKDTSALGLSLVSIPFFLGGCEDVLEAIRNRPVRRCIRDADEVNAQLEIYKDAVSAMKALPGSDPRSWTNQASIHQNYCPHGNWFFFPWHRVYLFYFEKICQELTGEASFGLPYWDWCVHPQLPAQFWGAGNPLNNATRMNSPSSSASASSVGLPLVDGYCNETNFNLFAGGTAASLRPGGPRVYGNVDGTPHNYIHGTFIRGDMATFMSPLDPIFWSHHCMVDVCWYEWNILRNHPNTNDASWLNFDYSGMFVDGQGNPASMATNASVLMPLLSYRYETGIDCQGESDLDSIAANDKAAFENTKAIIKKGAPDTTSAESNTEKRCFTSSRTGEGNQLKMDRGLSEFNKVIGGDDERVILKLEEVREPKRTDQFLRVFVNKDDANRKTPTSDAHYAGSFFFFSHSREAKAETVSFTVDVTNTLRKLRSRGEMGDELSITLVAVPVDDNDRVQTSIEVRKVEFNIAGVSTTKMDLK